ncbi:MAG: cadmium transporter [Phycisphaerae bacterium]|nr:MAG: heavy metal translocating P-type ATPase [Planctomycetia bacterium]GJQ28085.1 MAG: cadmium transporter [Phycisphaerae bacterium]
MKTAEFKIAGMDCAEEVATLKKELGPMPGVQELRFDILNAKMIVGYAEDKVNPDDLQAAVRRTGMRAEPWSEKTDNHQPTTFWTRRSRTLLTTASGVLTAIGFVIHGLTAGLRAAISEGEGPIPLIVKVLYAAAVVAGVWFVLPKAWLAFRGLRPDMNLLMVVAVVGAIVIGQWLEAATVAFLFALSILLEAWSVSRARRAVAALMALTPPKARMIHDAAEHGEHEHMMDVADVVVGSTVLVKPGEKFPLDGKIIKGQTSVNQAPITGESMPVPKSAGDDVFAGTINCDGTVEFATTKVASDTTVAHIVKMVGEAQSRRSPSEQWVEKFARYYTPAVMVLAIAVIVGPPLLFDETWSKWFYEGLVLLVIACPCALVISTPVSIVAALASAAKNGVLIKGGLFVELPARLRAVAMDKTGTLTEGKPSVREIVPLSGHTEAELIAIAAAIESRSEHPLARAVMAHALALGVRPTHADDFQVIKGKGASAVLNGQPVWIGSHRYLEERGQETPEMHEKLEALSSAGSSVVVIGNNEHICGFIAVADRMRSDATASIVDLRAAGIQHIVMLTGDNKGTAEAIGREAGVDEVRAELLPEDKVKAVEELVGRYHQVAMIGDGVNDAPAMARSSLGIAMGVVGTDAAIETADIALMSDDLSKLAWLVRHSRRTLNTIRVNITASLVVKAIFVVLTLLAKATLWGAIAADTGVSLLVVLNALRLLTTEGSPVLGMEKFE